MSYMDFKNISFWSGAGNEITTILIKILPPNCSQKLKYHTFILIEMKSHDLPVYYASTMGPSWPALAPVFIF